MSRISWLPAAAGLVLTAFAASAETRHVEVTPAAHHDVSPPLWLIPDAPRTSHADHEPRKFPRANRRLGPVYDPVLQSSNVGLAAPPTATTFEAMGSGFTGPAGTFKVDGTPPDTDGAVGPNDYVSLVNSGFAVLDKSGNVLFGPVQTNTIFSSLTGTECK